jgi:carboxyl-terminal processing protease
MKTYWFFFCVICVIILSGCSNHPAIRHDASESNVAAFEKTWQLVRQYYPYLEYKSLDWDNVYRQFRPQITNASPDEFVHILSDMLNVLQDQHVYLKTPAGELVTPYVSSDFKKANTLFSLHTVKKYFSSLTNTASENIHYSVISGNIGYIHISSFRSDRLMQEFYSIQHEIENTRCLIIDIRNNTGGFCTNVYQLVSWFLDAPLEHPPFYVNGILQPTQVIPAFNPCPYRQPVVVLINGVCYSSGDLFALLMKQLTNVTVIGDTTGGGSAGANSNAPGNFRLPDGTILHLGTIDFRDYNDKPWENVGIAPDVQVTQSSIALQHGIDRQMEYALSFLRDENVKTAQLKAINLKKQHPTQS